jgi:hypothetical protein
LGEDVGNAHGPVTGQQRHKVLPNACVVEHAWNEQEHGFQWAASLGLRAGMKALA